MSAVTYVRWKAGEARELTVFPPLAATHPAAADPCLLCDELLGNGTPTQLFALGPDDARNREKHTAGRWYTAHALLLHEACLKANGAVGVLGAVLAERDARIERLQLKIQGYQVSDGYEKGHEHGTKVAAELLAKIERLTAGADNTPPDEGTAVTPGQWIARFLQADLGQRMVLAEIVIQNAEEAAGCFIESHKDTIAASRRAARRPRAATAVDLRRLAARGRTEYAQNAPPTLAGQLLVEAQTFENAAALLEDPSRIGLHVPSWMPLTEVAEDQAGDDSNAG